MTSFTPIVLSLRSQSHTLSLHILPFGLTLHRLLLINNSDQNQVSDLLVGPQDPKDHDKYRRCFFGPLVGRFANRLPAGNSQYDQGDGSQGSVHLLEWGGSSISHHGGPPSENPSSSTSLLQSGPFDRCVWRTVDPNQSLLFSDSCPNSDHSQIFAIESPSDDNGYPGHLRVEVQIRLLPPTSNQTDSNLGTSTGKVSILYRTKLLDSSSTVITTPVNLTHHWGFNLSCSNSDKVEDEIIDDHHLQIFPSNTTQDSNQVQLLETDSNSGIPTGNYSSTKDTSHDFMNKRKIKDDQIEFPKDGYDHFYIFGPPSSSEKIKPSVILSSESSKLALSFKTNQSGVQLYTANGQPESPASIEAGGERKTLHGKRERGRGNCKRSAAFLEFAHPHGNFLHGKLREISGSDTLVRKGGQVRDGENWVEVEVWKKE